MVTVHFNTADIDGLEPDGQCRLTNYRTVATLIDRIPAIRVFNTIPFAPVTGPGSQPNKMSGNSRAKTFDAQRLLLSGMRMRWLRP